jgi:uncharacterized protein (TIGR00251 family)
MTRDALTGVQVGEGEGFLTLPVIVKPSGRANRVTGVHDGALRVEVTAPPERGRANETLVRILADLFGLPRAAVSVIRGQGSRRKVVRIEGVARSEGMGRIAMALEEV